MTNSTLNYASGPAGCGKTHAAINESTTEAAQGGKVLIVQPSIALISQTEDDINAHLASKWWGKGVSVTPIHGPKDGTPPKDSVFRKFVAHVEDDATAGNISLVTNETFKKKGRLRRPGWTLIKDEESSVVEPIKVYMPDSHVLVTPHLELKEVSPGSKHAFVKAKRGHKKKLEAMRDRARKDTAIEAFTEFLTHVLDPNCRVMITFEIWKALIDGSKESDTTEFCVLIGPAIYAGYSSSTVMCALFEHTMQYKLWTNPVFGAEFTENEAFKQHMRNQTGSHRNSAQWTILGAYEGPWYDNAKDDLHVNGQTHLELFASAAENYLAGAPYAFCANKDDSPLPEVKHHFIKGHTNRVGNMPQGLNQLYEKGFPTWVRSAGKRHKRLSSVPISQF